MKNFARLFAPVIVILFALALVSRSQNPPAPTVDRVLFPADYQTWPVLYTFDRADTKQIIIVYGNDLSASVVRGGEFDYPQGSILVGETWPAMSDGQGNLVLDSNGRMMKVG